MRGQQTTTGILKKKFFKIKSLLKQANKNYLSENVQDLAGASDSESERESDLKRDWESDSVSKDFDRLRVLLFPRKP